MKDESFLEVQLEVTNDMRADADPDNFVEATMDDIKQMLKEYPDEALDPIGIVEQIQEDGSKKWVVYDPALFEESMQSFDLDKNDYATKRGPGGSITDVKDIQKLVDNMPVPEHKTVANFYQKQLMPYVQKKYPG